MKKLLKVLTYPSSALSLPAKPITEITEEIKTLAEDMLYTMEKNNGIGLAANQVGVLLQIAVINIDDIQEEEIKNKMPLILINPKIINFSKELMEYEEGCLSFPELKINISRPKKVTVSYKDLNNQQQTIKAEGLLAICLQHEIDHLKGILFINKVSKIKKDILLRKYKKMQQAIKNK